MEGRTDRSMTLVLFATALVIVSSGCSFANAEKGKLVFTYYLHDDFIPPDATAVQVASANGTFTNTQIFGDITVFDSVLREGIEKDSPVIGSAAGQIVALKSLIFITLVHDVTIPGSSRSGTLSGSARVNMSAPSWEIGISTGTGSFRGAAGYFTVSIADPNPLGVTVKYIATVLIPK